MIKINSHVNREECLVIINARENDCNRQTAKYATESLSRHMTIVQRKIFKTTIRTMGDIVKLVSRVLLLVGKVDYHTIIEKFITEYTAFKEGKELNPQTTVRIINFYVLARALAYIIEAKNMLVDCNAWFKYYSCSDLQLLTDFFSPSQRCGGIIGKKLLGMMYSAIQTSNEVRNFVKDTKYYLDLSTLLDAKQNHNLYFDYKLIFDKTINDYSAIKELQPDNSNNIVMIVHAPEQKILHFITISSIEDTIVQDLIESNIMASYKISRSTEPITNALNFAFLFMDQWTNNEVGIELQNKSEKYKIVTGM